MLAKQAMPYQFHAVGSELVSADALSVVAHGNAARLASRNIAAFEDNPFKTALDQFVRSTHSGDTAAQDDDPSRHALLEVGEKALWANCRWKPAACASYLHLKADRARRVRGRGNVGDQCVFYVGRG